MKTATVKAKIPDGWELACDEMRPAKKGERYLANGGVCLWSRCTPSTTHYVIVRPAWQWPKWLTAKWIAMDSDGKWWAYVVRPERDSTAWQSESPNFNLSRLAEITDLTLPECDDWRESLMENPHKEVSDED